MKAGALQNRGKPLTMKADRELIEKCVEGDRSAFEKLIQLYERKVFGLIYQTTRSSDVVEDLAQEVFVKVYFSLPKFRLDASFDAWIYRITLNHCYDYLRKRQSAPQVLVSELTEDESQLFENLTASTASDTPDTAKRLEMRQIAGKLLGLLHPLDRSLLILKEVEELSIEELARVFKTSKSAIKLRLFRARNHLRDEYQKIGRKKGRHYEPSI
jgi:RNA polymerase sigma-70 factor, ECF subfamily